MSDLIYRREKNLGVVLVPIGVVGLVGTFGYLFNLALSKSGVTSLQTWTVGACFLVSMVLTVLGNQVKVISSLSGGLDDDEGD